MGYFFTNLTYCIVRVYNILDVSNTAILNVFHLHSTYENIPSLLSLVFTRFIQFGPRWPQMTVYLHQNNRLLVLNVVHLHTKYEICPSFSSWDISCLQAGRHNTHTHTHSHTYTDASMMAKVTIIIKTKNIHSDVLFIIYSVTMYPYTRRWFVISYWSFCNEKISRYVCLFWYLTKVWGVRGRGTLWQIRI